MQRLEVSGAVRPIYVSLGVQRLSSVETFFRAGQATDNKMAYAHCMLDN
jgi:hypothetical protein